MRWLGMSEDGRSVTLKKFEGDLPPDPQWSDSLVRDRPEWLRRGAVIDLETTGFSFTEDEPIEIGLRTFWFDRRQGKVLKADESYQALQEPRQNLSSKITQLTGLTMEQLAGNQIDWSRVDELLETVDLVIAHNANFDRPFTDRFSSVSQKKVWGCSVNQVDWFDKGFNVAKLEMLAIYHGFFVRSHRALADVDALLYLLSLPDPHHGRPYLDELLKNARKPRVKIFADGAPYEAREQLKRRHYKWDPSSKVWSRVIQLEQLEDEKVWLEAIAYKGEFAGSLKQIPLTDHFKNS